MITALSAFGHYDKRHVYYHNMSNSPFSILFYDKGESAKVSVQMYVFVCGYSLCYFQTKYFMLYYLTLCLWSDGVKLSFSILFYYLKGKQNAIEKEKENRSTMFMQREVKYFIWK